VVALRAQSARDNDGFLGCLAVVGPMSLYGFVTNTHLKFIIALRSTGPHDYKDSTVKAVCCSGSWVACALCVSIGVCPSTPRCAYTRSRGACVLCRPLAHNALRALSVPCFWLDIDCSPARVAARGRSFFASSTPPSLGPSSTPLLCPMRPLCRRALRHASTRLRGGLGERPSPCSGRRVRRSSLAHGAQFSSSGRRARRLAWRSRQGGGATGIGAPRRRATLSRRSRTSVPPHGVVETMTAICRTNPPRVRMGRPRSRTSDS